MTDGESGEGKDELAKMLASFARDLRQIDVETVLEAQVLGQLMHGPRTIPELMESIYGVSYADPEYASAYMKVRRSIQNLAHKGYVSRPLLGQGRPYRLTELAIARVTNIGGRQRRIDLVSRSSLVLYVATTVLGSVSLALGVDVVLEAWVYVAFAFLLGASATNMYRTLRRVA